MNIDLKLGSITERMQQLKTLRVISTNFARIKEWLEIIQNFLTITKDSSTSTYTADLNNITNADLKNITTSSIDINSDGEGDVFSVDKNSFNYRGFVVTKDAVSFPYSTIRIIRDQDDVNTLKTWLAGNKTNGDAVTVGTILFIINMFGGKESLSLGLDLPAIPYGRGLMVVYVDREFVAINDTVIVEK